VSLRARFSFFFLLFFVFLFSSPRKFLRRSNESFVISWCFVRSRDEAATAFLQLPEAAAFDQLRGSLFFIKYKLLKTAVNAVDISGAVDALCEVTRRALLVASAHVGRRH